MKKRVAKKYPVIFFVLITLLLFGINAFEASADVIIDNGEQGTSYTGTWYVSGGSYPYDYVNDPEADSLWARNGATYTWQFDAQPSGTYEVYMWWSEHSSRPENAAVTITHGSGRSTVTVNQKLNAGQWNSLGQFSFNGSGRVKITAVKGSTLSTCADAVWFRQVSSDMPKEIIIDNGAASTSFTGTWSVSGANGYYGTDSLWSRDGTTYTWAFTPKQSGEYDLSMWWTEWSSRSADIPVDIQHAGGSTRVSINQQQNGAHWNLLGRYVLNAGVTYNVTITSQPYPASTCADAVRFAYISGTHTITATAGTNGSITPSGAVTIEDGADQTFTITPDTNYRVANVLVDGSSVGSVTSYTFAAVSADHTIDATFEAITATSHTITATAGTDGSITPSGAVTVEGGADQTFAITPDTNYRVADVLVDGVSVGTVTSYTFTAVTADHMIDATFELSEPTVEVIIDNGDPQTSFTGTWSASGASGYYDEDSLWSRDGTTYTWTFTPQQSGQYDLSMWWTVWSSRSSNIPVDIEHWGGTDSIYIDQQSNGGKWNLLGLYSFIAGETYQIKITSQPYPSSTCADAVRFVPVSDKIYPEATINSITPNPALPGATISFSGSGSDADGYITAYSWYSTLDGPLSDQPIFSTSTLSEGIHSIFFKVRDDDGDWSSEKHVTVDVNNSQVQTEERIFFAPGYSPRNGMTTMIAMLQSMGATLNDGVWTYVNTTRNKRYLIYPVDTNQKWLDALKTEGSHILYSGHSNYGTGQVFATNAEFKNQTIQNIYYIDDDRIVNTSSPWINVSVSGIRKGHSFPFWWPEFKDGTSGIMPYDFGDPAGDPAYNYYITYQVPEDPNYYKMETVRNSARERFPDSNNPPWYSSTGQKPDASNPDQQKYFIRNTAPWSPSVETAGDWTESQGVTGYYNENYYYTPAGNGSNQVRWLFTMPSPGTYNVSAWWSASSLRTSGAPYTVSHAAGDTTVTVDQTVNGGKWNFLGDFSFDQGNYSVLLTDLAEPGNVVADAIRISHPGNPPDLIQSNFYSVARSGQAPLEVNFVAHETGDVLTRLWDFGDGTTEDTDESVTHIYKKPGTYTVSLTVNGTLGSSTKRKTGYVVAGSTTPPLQAEFTAGSRLGQVPLAVGFRDRSTGDVSSRLWDFGDGTTSTLRNPSKTYSLPGVYTVKLTITDPGGNTRAETKENFVRAIVFEKIIDNVDYPKTHYSAKTLLFRKDLDLPKEEMKYARMFYGGCASSTYYSETFNRGIFFYAVASTSDAEMGMSEYLKGYMSGKSDYELWKTVQDIEPLYDYYDFRKTPAQQW